ncbi:MAG: carbon-nitrogen hydrolase family protein [Burkholderiaceae bacterium]
MSPEPYTIAAVQMVSGARVDENLATAERLIRQAVNLGASMVVLPEFFAIFGHDDRDKCRVAEPHGLGSESPIQNQLSALAAELGITLVAGTLPIRSPDPDRVFNTVLVYDPKGVELARYDKLHLFAFDNGKERYDEARSLVPGTQPIACTTLAGRTGLSVCYDLRFPEFFRSLSSPSPLDLIVLPAAFTFTTGQAHWEILLRARAIENQCWLVASAQGGQHSNGRATWGHSMVIDPWGTIVACCKQGEGLALAKVDPGLTEKVRLNLPALRHRQSALQLPRSTKGEPCS